jgi:hypothetical protein
MVVIGNSTKKLIEKTLLVALLNNELKNRKAD